MSRKTEDDLIDEVMEDFAARAREELDSHIGYIDAHGGPVPESPLERIMLAALYFMDWHYLSNEVLSAPLLAAGSDASKIIDEERDGSWLMWQVPIIQYRADIVLFEKYDNIRIVVECDGHNFHERTKEQAQRDKARDREIQCLGWSVLRFTGSEIWRSPVGCAMQVQRHMDYMVHRNFKDKG